MDITTYSKEIVSLVVPFLGWAITALTKPRAKLVWGITHAFTFLVQRPLNDHEGRQISPTQTVLTASVTLVNIGKGTAKNIEIVFNWKPEHLNIWPQRQYTEELLPDTRYVLNFANLSPKENINFEMLTINGTLPALVTVRSEETLAKQLPLSPQEVHPRWKLIFAALTMLLGAATTVYLLLCLVQKVVLPLFS